jgi:membrane fusion protein (multidrug efflux system)
MVMIRRWVGGFLLLGTSLLLVACGENSAHEVVSATPLAAAANTAAPTSEAVFVASGPLVVEHQVDVAAQRDGLVSKILVEPGTHVKAGQTLALLDDRQLTADLEAARAKTRSMEADLKNWQAEAKVLQSDYERAQKLWDAQIISKEQLDHDRYKLESDQYDVQRSQELLTNSRHAEHSLELELEKTRISAPFEGIVARRYVRAGQEVTHGDRLFWVTAEAPLRVRFTLPEHFMGRIKKGTQLSLTTVDLPDEKHNVRVIEVSPVVDPSSATIEVLAELTGNLGQLRPGMSTNILVPNPQ